MKHKLEGSVALVTGASKGLGAAIACALAQRGARVALLARDKVMLQEVADRIAGHGGQAMTLPTDARDEAKVFDAAMRVANHWGDIALLINAMGGKIEGPTDGPADVLKQMIDVNYFAPMNVVRAVLPHMRRLQRGHIVNVSSVLGLRATPYRGAYAASKAALVAATDALRVELRRENIDVSLVCPGRLKHPDETGAGRFAMTYQNAADKIIKISQNPRARTVLTASAKFLTLLAAISPALVDKILLRARRSEQ